MDKAIHKYLDEKDALLEKVKADLEGVAGQLDLNELLQNPEEVLIQFAEDVANEIIATHMEDFIETGRRFGKAVKAKRTPVVVQDSKDPNLNEGVLGD